MRTVSARIAVVLGVLCMASTAAAATPLYPDMVTLPPRDLKLERTDVSIGQTGVMHNVLRFSNTVWNKGEGRLEVRAQIDPTTKEGPAIQRVYDTAGNFTEYTVGRISYNAAQNHYHYDNWGAYELWTKGAYDTWIASGRALGQAYLIGTKTTSCVMDEELIKHLPSMPYPAVFTSSGCNPNAQNTIIEGLSVGWGDTYDYYRAEQWIDLDQQTLPDGDYVLRSVSDPDNHVYESANKSDPSREDQQPNEAITPFTITAGKLTDTATPTGTIVINNAAGSTANASVNVKAIGRDDVSGVDQFRLSNDGPTWKTFSYTTTGSTPTEATGSLTDPAYGGTAANGT